MGLPRMSVNSAYSYNPNLENFKFPARASVLRMMGPRNSLHFANARIVSQNGICINTQQVGCGHSCPPRRPILLPPETVLHYRTSCHLLLLKGNIQPICNQNLRD